MKVADDCMTVGKLALYLRNDNKLAMCIRTRRNGHSFVKIVAFLNRMTFSSPTIV